MTLMCFGPLWVPINYFSGFQMTSTRCHAYFGAAYMQDIQQSLQQLLRCGDFTSVAYDTETQNPKPKLGIIEVNSRVPNSSLIDFTNNSNVRASPTSQW